ncbi:MAG: hypothetical protein ACE5G8_09260 [Anaerolineae bacterium]
MANGRQSLWAAVALIAVGVWFLLRNLGLNLPGLEHLWPGFIILGGASALWAYYSGRNPDPGQIFLGIAALGVGAFFLLLTLNAWLPVLGRLSWGAMGQLWPAFILIGGAAFLGQFVLAGFKDPGLLVVGVLALVVGLAAFVFTLGFLSRTLVEQALKFWPVILIVLGIGALVSAFSRRR